ncbi:unnamed protein product [Brassicogethes aeneus]|uniref:Uncharacterized protein n=1 Tax=Brassicogethes aeneus TaxID=1431903 RepID=A0A9P0AZM9_BRAAE|nr:unnamed protein product [Brassicogethes aeneus]
MALPKIFGRILPQISIYQSQKIKTFVSPRPIQNFALKHLERHYTDANCKPPPPPPPPPATKGCLLKCQVAIVTGATAGIGLEVAREILAQGARYGTVLGTYLGLNYMGTHNCFGNGGTIINVSGLLGGVIPMVCSPVYAGGKHFVMGFARALGNDFYKITNVRMMAIFPGFTITDLSDPKQMAAKAGYKDFGDAGAIYAKGTSDMPKQKCEKICFPDWRTLRYPPKMVPPKPRFSEPSHGEDPPLKEKCEVPKIDPCACPPRRSPCDPEPPAPPAPPATTAPPQHPKKEPSKPKPTTKKAENPKEDCCRKIKKREEDPCNPSVKKDCCKKKKDECDDPCGKNINYIIKYVHKTSNRKLSTCKEDDEPPICKCKVAIVTGGGNGIGDSIVRHLVMNGTKAVIVADTNEKVSLENMSKLNKEFGEDKVLFQKCDVSNREDLERMYNLNNQNIIYLIISEVFECTKNRFHKVDIVVNNAGILADCMWEKTICVNIYGTVLGTLLGFEYMGNHNCCGNGGVIINVASILGLQPCHGSPVYTGSKHFSVGFTRSIGDKWFYNKTGVKVMGLLPGVVTTEMTDNQRMIDMGGYQDIGEAGKELAKALGALPAQCPDECGKCVIEILKIGKTGELYISENKECYRVEIPDRKTMRAKDSKSGPKSCTPAKSSGGSSGGAPPSKCGPSSSGAKDCKPSKVGANCPTPEDKKAVAETACKPKEDPSKKAKVDCSTDIKKEETKKKKC